MTEAVKPQEMVVAVRPPVPGRAPIALVGGGPVAGMAAGGASTGDAWSDSLPVVEGSSRGVPLYSPALAPQLVPVLSGPQLTSLVQNQADEDEKDQAGWLLWLLGMLDDLPYWLASMVIHLVLFLLLSMCVRTAIDNGSPVAVSQSEFGDEDLEPLADLSDLRIEPAAPILTAPPKTEAVATTTTTSIPPPESKEPPGAPLALDVDHGGVPALNLESEDDPLLTGGGGSLPGGHVVFSDLGSGPALGGDMLLPLVTPVTNDRLGNGPGERVGGRGDGLAGRGEGRRGMLVAAAGGSPASERAVAGALIWLAAHQMPDGSWNFDHTMAPSCQGKCGNKGHMTEARNGATAIALLPFLGAGQTQRSGKYTETVQRGIDYLLQNLKEANATRATRKPRRRGELEGKPDGGSFFEPGGRMYSHGLATIALSEAYAMTHDKRLEEPVREAIDFIRYAQDPKEGGWRYVPQERGDTSMVGWQIMALKSGHMAGLPIPGRTTDKAMQYLDGVQANNGANYGYQNRDTGEATTAIGLLCRMFLGWDHDNPDLARGVAWLSEHGPSTQNMYYNYYATQVLRHWDGPMWRKWNTVMRDRLVETQAQAGHEAGSWFFPGNDHGVGSGARLYFTALAAMTLEVYYRYLPLYGEKSIGK